MVDYEAECRFEDGEYLSFFGNATPLREADGNVTGAVAAFIDITERKLAENALRESQERLAAALRAGKLGVFDFDPRTGRANWSRETYRLWGVPEGEEVTYEMIEAGVHPSDLDAFRAARDRDRDPAGSHHHECEYRVVNRADGSVRWLLADGDVTFEAGQPVRIVGTVQDITERKRAEVALRESEERERAKRHELETILSAIPAAVFIAEDAACRRMSANDAARMILRLPEGANASKSAPEPEAPTHFEVFSADGKLLKPEELPIQLAAASGRAIDGAEFELRFAEGDRKYLLGNALPLLGPLGDVKGAVGAFLDITEQKRAQERIHLLMREVNHRSKNLLTVVQAIARQTVASTPEEFLERFSARVQSLAASQDLLVKSAWKGVELEDLVRSQLALFGDLIGSRITLEGPAVLVSASAAETLGMALHELATNAGKYGALSNRWGRVKIEWTVKPANGVEATFCIKWRESGEGRPLRRPSGAGLDT